MPRRASIQKAEDANQAAYRVVREITGDPPTTKPKPKKKNPAAVALGKLGASKGGKARAAKLSPEARRKIARKAAKARWSPDQEPK